jgi:U-box domain
MMTMEQFICPITAEPVVRGGLTSIGQLYEYSEIVRWLEDHDTDPMTNMILRNKTILEIDMSKNIDEINKIIFDVRNKKVPVESSTHEIRREMDYYSYISSYAYIGHADPYIFQYAFSLNPSQHQPSGSVNLSRLS